MMRHAPEGKFQKLHPFAQILLKMINAASTRGFVVKAKPQRKSRRCAWYC